MMTFSSLTNLALTFQLKERLLCCMTDETQDAAAILGPSVHQKLTDDQWSQVLALRGLLAGRLLLHCLQKRQNVDFGVNRCGCAGLMYD